MTNSFFFNSTFKLIIAAFIFTNFCKAQEWKKTDITEGISIQLPGESRLTNTPEEQITSAQDEHAIYIVSVRPLKPEQASRINESDLPSLFKGVAQGTIDASKGTVVSLNDIVVQNIRALEMEYNVPANNNLPTHRFKRILYIKGSIINIDFWPLTDQLNVITEKKDIYFNSITLNNIESNEDQISLNESEEDNEATTSTKSGSLLGKVNFMLLLIAAIISVILLIKRITSKKKSSS